MKRKMFLFIVLVVVAAASIGLHDYLSWRQIIHERIQENNNIIQTKLGPIEYGRIGKGTAVLVIHGTPGGYDQGLFISKVINLSEYTFISPSRPGYLQTPLSVGKTFEEQADSFIELMNELNIEKAYILAVSGGGPSALQFALRHPDRCKGLILVSAISQPPAPIEMTQTGVFFQKIMQNALTTDSGNWLLSKIINTNPSMVIPHDPVAQLSDPEQQKLFMGLFDTLFPGSQRIVGVNNDTDQMQTMANFPFAKLSVPTLIIHGTEDRNVPYDTAVNESKLIPNAKLITIEGGPHEFFLIIPRQKAFVAEILSFLQTYDK